MISHGHNIVAGEPSREGDATFRAVDPTTRQTLGPDFTDATGAEIDRAALAAQGTIDRGWPTSPDAVAAVLEEIAARIIGLDRQLVDTAAAETALPRARIEAERGRTCGQLRLFASVVRDGSWADLRIDRADPARSPVPKPDVRRMLVPIGPVAVFAASNFPLAFSVAGGDTASALAAGNPVIVKAHPAHPGTSQLVGEAVVAAIKASGAPSGLFSLLHGQSHAVGTALVTHPLVQAVGFTGSLRGGRTLCDAAAARPQPVPVHAEMGSINPVFIMSGTLRDRTETLASALVQAVMLGVGQFCTNPGLVVLPAGVSADRFVEAAVNELAGTPGGTMLGEGIRRAYVQTAARFATTPGVRVAGESKRSDGAVAGMIFETDAATFVRTPLLSQECFGPSTLLVRCSSTDDMQAVASSLEGQLTATLMGGDDDLTANRSLIETLARKVGRLIFNGVPTGVEVCAAMHHGGPYPAASDVRFTSVGTAAIKRFARPICYQNWPQAALPEPLRDANPRRTWRMIDNHWTQDPVWEVRHE